MIKPGTAKTIEIFGHPYTMRWIPPGTFTMGSPEDEPGRFPNETQHEVTLTRGFWMGETTVTQALWQAVKGDNPSRFSEDPECPVEQVSWEDCVAWIDRANKRLEGFTLRLPSEAEWEYACRAGTTTPFHFGATLSTEQANYDGNRPCAYGAQGPHRQRTVPARHFEPNDWGLYQMDGNVHEWCQDRFGFYPQGPATDPQGPVRSRYRVLRGGSWINSGRYLRAAQRDRLAPGLRVAGAGFRLAGDDDE